MFQTLLICWGLEVGKVERSLPSGIPPIFSVRSPEGRIFSSGVFSPNPSYSVSFNAKLYLDLADVCHNYFPHYFLKPPLMTDAAKTLE